MSDQVIRGIFLKEAKTRFTCEVLVDGKVEICYLPSSCHIGKMIPLTGKQVTLVPVNSPNSKTRYAVFSVRNNRQQVLINLSYANRVIEKELCRRFFSELGPRKNIVREKCINEYKADLFIADTRTIIEVKTVLSQEEVALFPSMEVQRAKQQLEKIAYLLEQGYQAVYMIVSLNPKTRQIRLNSNDVEYYRLFQQCIKNGMRCYGYSLAFAKNNPTVKSHIEVVY